MVHFLLRLHKQKTKISKGTTNNNSVRTTFPAPIAQMMNVKAGDTVTADFKLTDKSFEFWDPETNTMRVKTGKYEIFVGTSSQDKDLKKLSITI